MQQPKKLSKNCAQKNQFLNPRLTIKKQEITEKRIITLDGAKILTINKNANIDKSQPSQQKALKFSLNPQKTALLILTI